MRKIVWIWVVVAFVAGLLPGAALAWWVRADALSTRQELVSRNSTLHAESQQLQNRLNASEASVSVLTTRLDQSRAGASVASAVDSTGAASGASPSGPPSITERKVAPEQVKPDDDLTLSVKLTGHAKRVNMRIVRGKFDKTYYLARVSSDSAGEVWEKSIAAPSAAGEYHYYAIAYDEAGAKFPMPGTSGWTFLVK